MALSAKRSLAYLQLELAMRKALESSWGVKVRVLSSNVSTVKATFYLLKKELPELESLSLLSTLDPRVFLIYHPERESDGDRMDETNNSPSTRDKLSAEEIL